MKRFEIITEADARVLDVGSTVELADGGIVTPLAKDTLASRRITIVSSGALDSSLDAGLVPAVTYPVVRVERYWAPDWGRVVGSRSEGR